MYTIAGVDLSLVSTGVVLLTSENKYESKLIKTKSDNQNSLSEVMRMEKIRDETINFIKSADIVVIEGLAFMARNTRSIVQLAGLHYLVRAYIQNNWKYPAIPDTEGKIRGRPPYIIVPPTSLKKFITDKGNAPKEQMLLETYKRYGESFDNNNLCDAYGLAVLGLAIVKKNKQKFPKFQIKAIKNINW